MLSLEAVFIDSHYHHLDYYYHYYFYCYLVEVKAELSLYFIFPLLIFILKEAKMVPLEYFLKVDFIIIVKFSLAEKEVQQ